MSSNGYVVYLKNKSQIVGFNQSLMPANIFEVSKELGYVIRVTGGFEITHEIECNSNEFKSLLDLCKELA